MFKILIIDDEESVREAIKILGDWQTLGIDEIIEANDGKTGSKLLCEEKPDIVLLDMRMPEMNGVEFLKAAERDFPQAVNIVISGYDDYEFTRQAIRSKVFDYLLKPVNREQLNNTLAKAIDSIKKRREKQTELLDRSMKMNMSMQTLKEKIYMSAIEGNLNNQINSTYFKIIGIKGDSERYGAAIMRILNITEICKGEFGGDMDILFFALLNIIGEICGERFLHFCCKNAKSENEIVIVAIDSAKNTSDMGLVTSDALTHAARKLRELLGIVAVFGVGSFDTGLYSLPDSYKQAATALNNINLFKLNSPDYGDTERLNPVKGFSILSKMSLLRSAIENGGIDYSNRIINEYLDKIADAGYISLRDANKMVNEFVFMMNDILLEFDDLDAKGTHDDAASLRLSGISFDYADFSQLRALILSIMRYYYDKIRGSLKFNQKFDVCDIKDYIDRNYFQEIKISMFTEKYYLSKVYIMKLFKQKFGMSIYEYVQKVRMDKAKELLRDPKINIQNISQMVGYSNNNYFSKAFKNYYHLSPSGYRMMLLKNSGI